MNPPLLAPPPPEAVPPTRSAASLVVTINSVEQTWTEATLGSSYWPEGIDYDSVAVPDAAPAGTFLDSLDTLDYLDD